MISNEEFFDTASSYYNEMTDFEAAVTRRSALLKNFTAGYKTAADLGCGTGIDSIPLSSLGIKTDGFDISQKMIEEAAKNAERFKAQASFYKSAIHEIPEQFYGKYSLVCSLGNTLSNVDPGTLLKSAQKIFNLLETNGTFLIQILNYDLITKNRERIVNITAGPNYHFVRFYDFNPDHIQFNILKYSPQNTSTHEMISTKLYPHSQETMKNAFSEAGFVNLRFYGSLKLDPYAADESGDLIILGEKI